MSVTVSGRSSIDRMVLQHLRDLIGKDAEIDLKYWSIQSHVLEEKPHILSASFQVKARAPLTVISSLGSAHSISWHGENSIFSAQLLINIYDLLGIEREKS